MRRIVAALLIPAFLGISSLVALLHTHAYEAHEHPEHQHGLAAHEHHVSPVHRPDSGPIIERCEPGQHAKALSACDAADFTFLRRVIGLTGGNLNTHLTTLETAGFVVLQKRFEGKVSHTAVSLTSSGRHAIDNHWRQLDALRREAHSRQTRTRLRVSPAESD